MSAAAHASREIDYVLRYIQYHFAPYGYRLLSVRSEGGMFRSVLDSDGIALPVNLIYSRKFDVCFGRDMSPRGLSLAEQALQFQSQSHVPRDTELPCHEGHLRVEFAIDYIQIILG